jgi:hypothetical protein
MTKTIGNSAKDSGYLKRLKDAIEHDKDHPRKHGIRMQAHHIISGDGMRRSKMGKKIEKFGYNINYLPNLVFIPCTLQGACYLGVQPHRGNHDFSMEQEDYQDDLEPAGYHELVATRLRRLELPMEKACDKETALDRAKVVDALDALSKSILNLIQFKPLEAPLTKLAAQFGVGAVGCSGTDSIRTHSRTRPCPVGRHHLLDPAHPELSQGPAQARENIKFVPNGKFRLKVKS